MSPQHKVITQEIRADILYRSSCVSTHQDVGSAIYDALVAAGVDWRDVSPGDVKSVLVEAIRASHVTLNCCPDPLAV